jgi:hypothetical protein
MKISINIAIWIAFPLAFSCNSKPKNSIRMTHSHLETDFKMINGIQIDEIRVDSFSATGIPFFFRLKESFLLRRKPDFSQKNNIGKVIFFDKENNGFEWINDSTWGLFDINVSKYKYTGYISQKEKNDYSYKTTFRTYPRKFMPDSWYIIDFKPTELNKKHHEFLNVTKESEFVFIPIEEVGE